MSEAEEPFVRCDHCGVTRAVVSAYLGEQCHKGARGWFRLVIPSQEPSRASHGGQQR